MNFKKVRNVGFILALFPAVCTAILQYTLKLTWADTIATAALGYAVLAFIGIWYTLWFTYAQLEKALAKPKLEVIFTDTNNNEKTVNLRPDIVRRLPFSVINKGNAITDLFQISFCIPKIYNPTINYVNVGSESRYYHIPQGENELVNYINNHNHVCFVNKPTLFPSLELRYPANSANILDSKLVIPYEIFGDWGEPQMGELKITFQKQEVA